MLSLNIPYLKCDSFCFNQCIKSNDLKMEF